VLSSARADAWIGIDLFLTLVGFGCADFAGPSYIVPAFQVSTISPPPLEPPPPSHTHTHRTRTTHTHTHTHTHHATVALAALACFVPAFQVGHSHARTRIAHTHTCTRTCVPADTVAHACTRTHYHPHARMRERAHNTCTRTHTRARAWANTSCSSETKPGSRRPAAKARHDADQRRPLIGTGPARRAQSVYGTGPARRAQSVYGTGPARRAQSVYGGYYASVGAEFFTTDFADPDTFGAKIAKQFLFGVQARARPVKPHAWSGWLFMVAFQS
jgi:hypothetical protein